MAANSKEWEGICVVRQPSNVRAIMDLLCWWDTHLFYIHYFLRPFLLFARVSTQILDTSKDKKIVILNWFIQYLVWQAGFFNTSTLSQVLAVFRKLNYLIMFTDLEMALVVYFDQRLGAAHSKPWSKSLFFSTPDEKSLILIALQWFKMKLNQLFNSFILHYKNLDLDQITV